MRLTLSVLAGPGSAGCDTRDIPRGTFAIGRGADNDWVLPDPQRHLSKRHCAVGFRDGAWEVTDLSTNGTFLNDERDPIGAHGVRDLRDGDRVRLGGYEIGVSIAEPASQPIDLFGSLEPEVFAGPVQPDHTPGVEDAFRPPRPVVLLDDDWDLSDSPAPPLVAAITPDLAPAPVPASSTTDLMAAFLRGAAMPDAYPADPVAAMERLGAAFRAMAGGLRETLAARAAVKSEFRIDQTVIRAHGNNSLKFSASDDDALLALVGAGRRTEMAPAAAVAEAFQDIRLHELAAIAAMQSAVRALLRELDPAKLRESSGGGLLEAQRKARAWEAFEVAHGRLTSALSDSFESAFGRSFARAYEQALREARAAS